MMNPDPEFRQTWREWFRPPSYKGRQPFHRRLGWLVGLLIAAGILILFLGQRGAFVTVGLGLVGAGLGLLVLIAVAEVLYHLFFKGQIRLIELLLLVAVLGNVVGGLYANERDQSGYPRPAWMFPLYVILAVFWILTGAAWGLWIARLLEVQNGWRRAGLMALGWSFVPGIILMLPLTAFTLVTLVEREWFFALGLGAALLACGGLLLTAVRLNKRALRRDPDLVKPPDSTPPA